MKKSETDFKNIMKSVNSKSTKPASEERYKKGMKSKSSLSQTMNGFQAKNLKIRKK